MYVKRNVSTLGGKKYHSELLVESYRESNTIKHRTIANLSHCSPEEIDAIDFALKNKKDLASCVNLNTSKKKQGKSIGAIFVLNEVAKRLGIVDAFGTSREANLCLWMTIGRLIQPGQSRLAARPKVPTVADLPPRAIVDRCQVSAPHATR